MPDIICVLADGAVSREDAGLCDIHNGETAELRCVRDTGIELILGLGIGTEVSNEHIRVAAVKEPGNQIGVGFSVTEAGRETVQNILELRIVAGNFTRIVAGGAESRNLILMQAEEEHILTAETLIHFDVGTVQCADGDGTVHHELHAASTGCFLTGSGDLLGNLCGRDNGLGGRNTVVLHKIELQLILAEGIIVDVGLHGEQKLNDAFGGFVAGGSLSPENIGAGEEGPIRVIMQLKLELGNVHSTEKLALVLMETLDLHVHNGIGIENNTVIAAGESGETLFILCFDGKHSPADGLVMCISGKFVELRGVGEIGVRPEKLTEEIVQAGIDLAQPAAMINTVGDIGEALTAEGSDIPEEVVFNNITVETGNTVDLEAGSKAHIGHVDLTVTDRLRPTRSPAPSCVTR